MNVPKAWFRSSILADQEACLDFVACQAEQEIQTLKSPYANLVSEVLSYRISEQFNTKWPPKCENVTCADWKSTLAMEYLWSFPSILFNSYFPFEWFSSTCK